MNTSETPPDGVYFRNSPHVSDTSRVSGLGVYSGEQVQLLCYAFGDGVGPYSDALWYDVLNVSRPTNQGVPDRGYLNAHYINDGKVANQADAGVPACGSTPTPQPSPAPAPTPAPQPATTADAAATWAKAQVGKNLDSNLCLTFAFAAYSAAGRNLRTAVSVPITSNTYPADLWGYFTSGTTGTGANAPAGALVFWASKTGDRTLSHVTVSIGGGTMVSTTDSLNESVVHLETFAQRSYSIELGWWLP